MHERVEQGIAGVGIEPPQAPNLRLREVQTGNFQELAANDRQPVGHPDLHRAHVRFLIASTSRLDKPACHARRLVDRVRHGVAL